MSAPPTSRAISGRAITTAKSSPSSSVPALPQRLRAIPSRIPLSIPTISFLIQLALIAYGEYQDTHSEVKYTDVDYRVFSDAVGLIWSEAGKGGAPDDAGFAVGWLTRWMGWRIGDPYTRATFRYTPLLPLLLSPIALSRSSAQAPLSSATEPSWRRTWIPWHLFGKVVFSAAGSWGVHGLLMSDGMQGRSDLGTVRQQEEWQEISEERDPRLINSPKQELSAIPESPSSGRGERSRSHLATSLLWTLNPMILNISTRGSSESVLALIVLCALYALKRSHLPDAGRASGAFATPGSKSSDGSLSWTAGAGALYALAIGWKVYPIVYGLSIWSWMYVTGLDRQRGRGRGTQVGATGKHPEDRERRWYDGIVTTEMIVFGFSAVGAFVVMTFVLWSIWGYPFLYHSYIYHVHRLDHRHNFSPYFYPIYLSLYPSAESSPDVAASPSILAAVGALARHPLASFVPQVSATLLAGLVIPLGPKSGTSSLRRGSGERPGLEFAWFVQTWVFVMFNKVCTSQYFLWFLFLLPPILPRLHMSRRKASLLIALWVGAQAIWLSIAYRLEFLGTSVYLPLWAAAILFLLVNAFTIGEVVKAYR